MVQETQLSITENTSNKLLLIQENNNTFILSINANFDVTLKNFEDQIYKFFTKDLVNIPSINYKQGDPYINEFMYFVNILGNLFTQKDDILDIENKIEKQLLQITCPSFTGKESFYEESLSYYLLFHSYYNILNIIKLLNISINDLNVSIFYNNKKEHFFCYYNNNYSKISVEITDKLKKNISIIENMKYPLWYNGYYILYRDVLQENHMDFNLNGSTLDLDIVNVIEGLL